LRAVLLVQVVLALAALCTANVWHDLISRVGQSAFAGVTGTLLWLVSVCALKPVLRKLPLAPRAAFVLFLGALAGVLAWLPLWALQLSPEADGLRATAAALVGLALSALLWAWLSLRARIWHPADSAARLLELQSRIRPHFLFNALNTAIALVRVDPERAESVLEDLSELFRVALADVGTSVSLQEEVELARRYLAIEQVRFGKRLQVSWEIDAQVALARVPPLLLQPLVENAVRHGIEPAEEGGRVSVQAHVKRGQAVILVSNTMSDEPSTPGHGMALYNIRERLRLLHDVAGQCDVWREGNMFFARVIVPM
jgi:two-component system sensor histidine kinase AlgZ